MQEGTQTYEVALPGGIVKPGHKTTTTLDQQVAENMHLVHMLARRVHRSVPRHMELCDLISAGSLGLLEALKRFNPDREVSFRTFASARIEGAMLDSLRKLDWGSRDLRRRGRAIERAIGKCTSTFGRLPEEEEVAKELGTTLVDLQKVVGELHGSALGVFHISSNPTEIEEVDVIADAGEPGALVHCLKAELRSLLARSLDALPQRQQQIVALYYHEELTFEEIASVMGLSASRVIQLRALALLALRSHLGEYASARVRL